MICFWRWRKIYGRPLAVVQLLVLGLLLPGCITSSSPSSHDRSHYYVDLQTNAGPLKVFVRDQGRGKPILFLHGFGASSYSWRYIQPELARTHRTISIDLKGFGRSDKPMDERYSLFDQADIVERFIEKQQLSDVTLVGHSYGGGVALAYAVNERTASLKRVSKLILLDSIAYRQNLPYFITALKTPVVSHLGLVVIPPTVQSHAALEFAYLDERKITWDAVQEYAKPLYSVEGKMALIRAAEQVDPPDIESFTQHYKELKLPTLIIWCRQDKIIRIQHAWHLKKDIEKSEMHILNRCGHAPQEEQPVETLRLIRGFL